MNDEMQKLLIYIDNYFSENRMKISGVEFEKVGLSPVEVEKWARELEFQKVISDFDIKYRSSIDPLDSRLVKPATGVHTLPTIVFKANRALTKKKLKEYDFPKLILSKQELHNVHFDKENGFLYIDGEKAGEVTPSTDHYIFILTLYDKANQPVSHEEIFDAVKRNKKTEITAQALSNLLKSEVKKRFILSINKIISSKKTKDHKNGYILKKLEKS